LKILKLNILLIIFSFLIISCKQDKTIDQKSSDIKNYSDLNLKNSLSNFTGYMTDKDTIIIYVDLSMEWWIRRDEIILTKTNNKIQLQATIKEDTTFEMKYQMRTNKLPVKVLKNENNSFEQYFVDKFERTQNEYSGRYIYKITAPNDTLIFYTNGLGDKGAEIKDYYKHMIQYYPNEEDFIPIEIIHENEIE
tara:strand:+ start:438 stop:1016 length:579 start_codon:yes stop_codon:yes gene_type:complete